LGGLSISHTNGYIARRLSRRRKVAEFQEFVSKHAFSRYCSQKTQVFVKRTALFREEVGRTVSDSAEIDEEIHALCEALVASEGRLGP
jgi:hypothetical protein